MKKPFDAADFLISRAGDDHGFRERLLAKPKETIEAEFGVTIAEDHAIHVHEETYTATHLVLPPRSKFTEAQREEAKTGAASIEFLRKTMHDPAPPLRPPALQGGKVPKSASTVEALVKTGRESIRRGLDFLESAMYENGAWRCIRSNVNDPDIPRHYEKTPFVSAFCVLALECCQEARARAICALSRAYLADTIEYPGLWRYYRQLPRDLDSTALCSLVIGTHPWVLLGRNIPRILSNRDEEGRFKTWVLEEGEPDVESPFRLDADPVVNANVIAYLGDHPETRDAQRWLEALINEGDLEGSSKWYPDVVAVYYAAARALVRARPALDRLRPVLADRILGLRDEEGGFGNILQTAQAASALHYLGCLDRVDAKRLAERFMNSQSDDGSWPELLAFAGGYIGLGSEAVTSAFCIEALERLLAVLQS